MLRATHNFPPLWGDSSIYEGLRQGLTWRLPLNSSVYIGTYWWSSGYFVWIQTLNLLWHIFFTTLGSQVGSFDVTRQYFQFVQRRNAQYNHNLVSWEKWWRIQWCWSGGCATSIQELVLPSEVLRNHDVPYHMTAYLLIANFQFTYHSFKYFEDWPDCLYFVR